MDGNDIVLCSAMTSASGGNVQQLMDDADLRAPDPKARMASEWQERPLISFKGDGMVGIAVRGVLNALMAGAMLYAAAIENRDFKVGCNATCYAVLNPWLLHSQFLVGSRGWSICLV